MNFYTGRHPFYCGVNPHARTTATSTSSTLSIWASAMWVDEGAGLDGTFLPGTHTQEARLPG